MLFPYLYHCPEKLQGILCYDENENLFFVFGDKYISLDRIRILVETGCLTIGQPTSEERDSDRD